MRVGGLPCRTLGIDTGVQLEFYVDADCAYKPTDWRSISGGVVTCAGACVSFFSRMQTRVTLSSTEAFCRLHVSGEHLARGLL
ncbi:unnamed protein product [Laminaria digitata]